MAFVAMVAQPSWSHNAGWHDAWMWVPVTLMALAFVAAVRVDLSLVMRAARSRRAITSDRAPEAPDDLMDRFHEFITRVCPDDFES